MKIHKNTPTCFDLNRSSSGSTGTDRDILTDDDLLRSKQVGVFLCIFMYFIIEIGILY